MIDPINPTTMPAAIIEKRTSTAGLSAKVKYADAFSHVVIEVPIIKLLEVLG